MVYAEGEGGGGKGSSPMCQLPSNRERPLDQVLLRIRQQLNVFFLHRRLGTINQNSLNPLILKS